MKIVRSGSLDRAARGLSWPVIVGNGLVCWLLIATAIPLGLGWLVLIPVAPFFFWWVLAWTKWDLQKDEDRARERCARDSDWCDGRICGERGIDCPNSDRNRQKAALGAWVEEHGPIPTNGDER